MCCFGYSPVWQNDVVNHLILHLLQLLSHFNIYVIYHSGTACSLYHRGSLCSRLYCLQVKPQGWVIWNYMTRMLVRYTKRKYLYYMVYSWPQKRCYVIHEMAWQSAWKHERVNVVSSLNCLKCRTICNIAFAWYHTNECGSALFGSRKYT